MFYGFKLKNGESSASESIKKKNRKFSEKVILKSNHPSPFLGYFYT